MTKTTAKDVIYVPDSKKIDTMSNAFRKEHGEVWIPFPHRIDLDSLKEVKIPLKRR